MSAPTPFDATGDEPLEARIVAWVLGEASAFEAAELERLCEERPELLVFRRRMRTLHGLLTESEAAESDDSWKLPPDKRKALDELFGEETPATPERDKETQIRRSGRRALLAIAACVMLTLFLGALFSAGNASIQKARKSKQIIQYSATRSAADEEIDMLPGGVDILGGTRFKLRQSRDESTTPNKKIQLSASPMEKGKENFAGKDFDGFVNYGSPIDPPAISQPRPSSSPLAANKSVTNSKRASAVMSDLALSESNGRNDRAAGALPAPRGRIVPRSQTEIVDRDADSPTNSTTFADDKSPVRGAVLDVAPASPATSQPTSTLYSLADNKSAKESKSHGVVNDLAEPDKAVRDQEDKVDERRKMLAAIARTKGTIYKGQDSSFGSNGVKDDQGAQDAAETGKHLAQEKQQLESQINSLQKYDSDQLATYAGGLNLPDNTVKNLYPQLLEKQKELYKLKSQGLGGEHSAVKAESEQVEALKRQVDEGIVNLRQTLQDQLAMTADRLKNVESRSLTIREDAIKTGLDAQDYEGAKRNLETDQELLDQMKLKHLADNATQESAPAEFAMQLGVEGPLKSESAEAGAVGGSKTGQALPELTSGAVITDQVTDEAALEKRASKIREILEDPANQEINKQAYFREWKATQKKLQELAKTKPALAKKSPLESMEEIAASEEPYSTFSLNINDASFQIAKAALDKGERPDPEAIKVEQFYNAVDYGDPAPATHEPIAARIEQAAHPVIPGRNLIRVSLKTAAAGRGASQPLRLTLLVDQSGSMVREDRRTAMSNALKQLGGLLTPNDHITVVGFSRESHLLADNWTGDKAGKLGELVNQTASEGGTNLEQAINLAEQMAARPHPAGEQNRIVLFTDGAANLGDAKPERLAERVKSLRQKGIAFDIAGIGADGVNDRLLSELARNGNGRYYVVGDSKNESFARQLAGAFRPAAENVKVQVNFNPERVGRYKLIGFEKDRLKTEDFRNDAVDAAELAAEEAGVAIYQVETLPQGSGEIGEVSVRFRDTSKGEMVERKWTMPYESTTQVFDRATPSMQLAGLSMLAAEKLKGGPLADAIDFRQLGGPQSLVKQFYGSSPRVADMLHVIDLLK